jgi:hypothetical protein
MHILGKIPLFFVLCVLLSSCETVKEIQKNDLIDKVGSFRLNPVQPGTYWYDGKTYEYNEYEIEMVSVPGRAHIKWDGKYIGDTPMKYSFTGSLDKGDAVKIIIIPFDEASASQEASLKIRDELPRKMSFDLRGK